MISEQGIVKLLNHFALQRKTMGKFFLQLDIRLEKSEQRLGMGLFVIIMGYLLFFRGEAFKYFMLFILAVFIA